MNVGQTNGKWRPALLLTALLAVFAIVIPSVAFAQATDWKQVHDEIPGDAPDDRFGAALAISADGRTIAVGASGNDAVANSSGHVRILRNDGTGWTQLGSDIEGSSAFELFGFSVAMSNDGETVVVGVPYYSNDGRVQVFRFDGSDWAQVGSNIDADDVNDRMGRSVAISDDGSTIAVAASQAAGNRGHVKIFRELAGDWDQVGDDIVGDRYADWSGASVDLSNDGSVVAIGSPEASGVGYQQGHVRVFAFNAGSWNQIGSNIDGEFERDWFGFRLALSGDGSTVVAGAPWNDALGPQTGQARVFQFDGSDWAQRGSTISGEAANDYMGWDVGISDDGLTIATSRPRYDGAKNNAGETKVFSFNGIDWAQLGPAIDGQIAGERSGSSVALTPDGGTLAIGAPFKTGTPGAVRVYALDGGDDDGGGDDGGGDGGGDDGDSLLADGKVVILKNLATDRYLDGDGVHRFWNVDTSPTAKFDARWKLTDNGDGTWSLLNARRMRYLDADSEGRNWTASQSVEIGVDDKWEITEDGEGVIILRNTAYDRYLAEAPDSKNVVTIPFAGIDDRARWIVTSPS